MALVLANDTLTIQVFGVSFSAMRRTSWARVLAASLAVWFGFTAADPRALHACPLHDDPQDGAPRSGAEAHAIHRHGDGVSHSPAAAGHGPHSGTHRCTCPGACCAAASVAAPVIHESLVVVSSIATEAPTFGTSPAHRPSAPEHARPPSVGPPLLHA